MVQKEDGMLRERLTEQGVLILDGALATELERRGCNLQDSLWSAKMLMEEREKKIKELLKDLEMELPQPIFEKVKEELLQVL